MQSTCCNLPACTELLQVSMLPPRPYDVAHGALGQVERWCAGRDRSSATGGRLVGWIVGALDTPPHPLRGSRLTHSPIFQILRFTKTYHPSDLTRSPPLSTHTSHTHQKPHPLRRRWDFGIGSISDFSVRNTYQSVSRGGHASGSATHHRSAAIHSGWPDRARSRLRFDTRGPN